MEHLQLRGGGGLHIIPSLFLETVLVYYSKKDVIIVDFLRYFWGFFLFLYFDEVHLFWEKQIFLFQEI